jgi:DNA modification methylase
VGHLVQVFRELRRVLKDGGTIWLNLGDSYGRGDRVANVNDNKRGGNSGSKHAAITLASAYGGGSRDYFAPKNLVGIPWRVAFALQADGWYLRSDIIWSKPNPMPESVTDRPTKAHEYLFLLSKSERYFYDCDAIKERSVDPESLNGRRKRNMDDFTKADPNGFARSRVGFSAIPDGKMYELRNRRSVWHIPTRPNSLHHFATMPEALVEPCILAGCPLGGLVLDPFVGSGTVVAVAQRFGRRGVGVDLSYQQLAKERTAQQGIPFVADEIAG